MAEALKNILTIYDTIRKNDSLTESEKNKVLKILGKKECIKCSNLCDTLETCEFCIRNFLEKNFNWTSGDDKIDELIQNHQKSVIKTEFIIEWIPYDKLDVQSFFSKRFKAIWKEGKFKSWDFKQQKLIRSGPYPVTVKRINFINSKNRDKWLKIIEANFSLSSNISPIPLCYGLTKVPIRDEYLIVIENMEYNLKTHLPEIIGSLKWIDKYKILLEIAESLKCIHNNKLIIGDLRTENIMHSKKKEKWLICDFGYCLPIDKPSNEFDEMLEVTRYTAPEIIKEEQITTSSDIYSFAMIMWEISSGYPPFEFGKCDLTAVVNGLRPPLIDETPQHYSDLMEKCWNKDSSLRPNITLVQDELENVLNNYRDDSMSEEELKIMSSINWYEKFVPIKVTEGELRINEEAISRPVTIIHPDKITVDELPMPDSIGNISPGWYSIDGGTIKVAVKRLEIDIESKSLLREKISERHRIYNHSNIVEFLGICIKDEKLVLVTPFADNGNLRQYFKSKLSENRKIRIAINITDGIKVLHENNIIHENLNPTNILIFNGIAKISDLPLPSYNNKNKELYAGDKLFDNIGYIDPNAFLDKNYEKDKPMDIYSLGILLWEIMSETIPYSNDKNGGILQLVTRVKSGYREKDIDGVPDEYTKLYKRCWNKNYSDRPRIKEVHGQLSTLAHP